MSIPPDTSPTRPELLAEVRRLVYVTADVPPVNITVTWGPGGPVITRDRPEPHLPEVGSAEWWIASDQLKAAAVLVLAESLLFADPDRQVRERLRQVSQAISSGMDWSAACHHLAYEPHRVLAERRAEPGPVQQVDLEALVRWVETGHSGREGTAA